MSEFCAGCQILSVLVGRLLGFWAVQLAVEVLACDPGVLPCAPQRAEATRALGWLRLAETLWITWIQQGAVSCEEWGGTHTSRGGCAWNGLSKIRSLFSLVFDFTSFHSGWEAPWLRLVWLLLCCAASPSLVGA